MGITAVSWVEILAWADRFFSIEEVEWVKSPTNRWMPIVTKQPTLLDYEIHILKFMSQEYSAEYAQASDKMRKCPIEIEVDNIEVALRESTALGDALFAAFG